MSWLNSLSATDRREMYEDAVAAFKTEAIDEWEFRQTLIKLGYNASDIEDEVRNAK